MALALSMAYFLTMAQERSSTIPVLDMSGQIDGVVDAPTTGTFTFTAEVVDLLEDSSSCWRRLS